MRIDHAARALARGDALAALNLLGPDTSSGAALLRGIAYAQLGDLELSARALQRAGEAKDATVRARARAAAVELTLRSGEPAQAREQARASALELVALGDVHNATLQSLNVARAEILLGRLGDARETLSELPALRGELAAICWLARAELAIRAGAAREAASALRKARSASKHPLLAHECGALQRDLTIPLAKLQQGGRIVEADLMTVEHASAGAWLLVDACRLQVLAGRAIIPLARRPVLFKLLEGLARAWPADVARDELARRAFQVRKLNDSHRARLRVEIGRLRAMLRDVAAAPEATRQGYVLRSVREVAVLSLPSDDDGARLTWLLGDGATWSAQSLAEHAGVSKRTAQRALTTLVEHGRVERTGSGRDVGYRRHGDAIASRMLLLGLLPKP